MSGRQYLPSIMDAEANQAHLIRALWNDGSEIAADLAHRLACCRERREQRRAIWNSDLDATEKLRLVKPLQDGCNLHSCWSCGPRRCEGWAYDAAQRWTDADNKDCSLITIASAVTGNLHDVRQHIVEMRQALRNRRRAAIKEWGKRWGQFEASGHVEPDPFWVTDIPSMGSEQRALIQSLPVISGGDMRWVVRAHLVAHHPQIGPAEVQEALSRTWRRAGQVHLEAFNESQLARENAGASLVYGIKRRTEHTVAGVTETWPISWQVEFFSYLHSLHRWIEPLRVEFGPVRDRRNSSPVRSRVIEPMPVLF